jgi:hypothetical protein
MGSLTHERGSSKLRRLLERPGIRDLTIVLATSWLARAVFMAAIGDAHSLDVDYWEGALEALDEGRNPYETGVLNWPPLWLEIIVGLDAIADVTEISFWSALRIYLVFVESALVVSLYFTLVAVGAPRAVVRRALLFGIALNPVTILLVCQHGNSDVNVGFLVTAALAALLAHRRSRDVIFWLGGCLLLGVGVLAKTVPLVLAPVLAPGARLASSAGKVLGVTLLLGPAALGLSVIMSLVPREVVEHVIRYRSTRGFFGLSGMLEELTRFDARSLYASVFTLGVLLMVVWLWRRLSREEPLPPERLFLLVAVVLMVVVAFGPGYGPQYAYWFLPALVATYVLLDDAWRRLLRIGFVVAGLTYGVEYAFVPWLGSYADGLTGDTAWVADVSDYLDVPRRLVLFRLPLFMIYLVLIFEGIRRLTGRRTGGLQPASPT